MDSETNVGDDQNIMDDDSNNSNGSDDSDDN